MQTVLGQCVELVPPDVNVLKRTRHAQLPDDGIHHITQVGLSGVNAALLQKFGDNGHVEEEAEHALLTRNVGVLCSVPLAHRGEEDAACLAVTDAKGTEL